MSSTPLDIAFIKENLRTQFVGQNFLYYHNIPSTMEIARKEALNKCHEGTAVFAELQTAGRGRLKRQWLTPEGNIAVSIIIYPPPELFSSLIMLASVAVVNSIKNTTGIDCTIKWPNDVLIDGKKVCGILIETCRDNKGVCYAILGIGINVGLHAANHPDIKDIAVGLSELPGKPVSREDLLTQLFNEIERLYSELKMGNSLYPLWKNKLGMLDKPVKVHSMDTVLEGIAEDVAEDGSLMLRLNNGELKRITIGDVSLRNAQ
jgi:BirA family biotin operon repressor/biotin-[acetyl-CoA-carboxylase] ligase